MKLLKKLIGTLLATLAMSSHAGLTDGHFGINQIFDVQYYWSGNNLNASSFIAPYDMNFTHPTLSAGQYFAFFASTTNPGTYGLGLYNSNGSLAQTVHNTGTLSAIGPDAIFYVGSGFFGTVITTSAGYAYGSSATFTSMDQSVSVSDSQTYTWASATPLTAGQTASSPPPSSPNVTGTSTANQVTTSTSNGTAVVTTNTTDGPITITTNSVNGTPVAVTVESRNRGEQTAKALAVNQIFTTTTTTPVTTTTTTVTPWTTVTTTTTPVTTTTTTTPVTTTTYSDNTTATTNGTAVVTTSTTNTVTETTQTGSNTVQQVTNSNTVQVGELVNTYTTRIDAVARLVQTSSFVNHSITGLVVNRFTNDAAGIKLRTGSYGDSDNASMYILGDGQIGTTSQDYYNKGNIYGFGVEKMNNKNFVSGFNIALANGSLAGPQAGGTYQKTLGTIYGLYNRQGWLINATIGYSDNTFSNYHAIEELALSNAGATTGYDYWIHTRVYTPSLNGFKLLAGARSERNIFNGYTESGSDVSAVTYTTDKQTVNTTEAGFRIDQQIGQLVTGVEYVTNSKYLQTTTATVGFLPKPNVVGSFGLRNQRQHQVENNAAFLDLNWKFN